MSFFNSETADIVQLISLPLEIVGFVLAIIELKSPEKADKIEKYIDQLPQRMREWVRVSDTLGSGAYRFLIFIAIVVTILICIFMFTNPNAVDMISTVSLIAMIIAGGLMGLSLVLYLTFEFLMPPIIDYLNYFSDGKALGTLGVLLALIGVLGEVYQVVTIFSEYDGVPA